MSYLSLAIHCVWSTKNRVPFLKNKHDRYELYSHMRSYSISKGIFVDHIGGFTDHVHYLFFLKTGQTIDGVMNQIKGESSHWFSSMHYGELQWQDGFFAVSVSPDRLKVVRRYIQKQEEHHEKCSFDQEYTLFKEHIDRIL